jgi:hypothetical protein
MIGIALKTRVNLTLRLTNREKFKVSGQFSALEPGARLNEHLSVSLKVRFHLTLLSGISLHIMASSQRFAVSLFLVFTVLFAFLAQSAQAARGPKITHKVWPYVALIQHAN